MEKVIESVSAEPEHAKPLGHGDGDGGESMFEVHFIDPTDEEIGVLEGENGEPAVFVLCDRDPESLWGVAMTPAKARRLADWLRSAADIAEASGPITRGGEA